MSVFSSAPPASAVTPSDVTTFSENLTNDSGMIATAADLSGADSDLVKEFQLGVKYGEFATRLYQGDYWGVASDFIKFELGREVDRLTDSATKRLLSAGAQRMLGVFTALKDTGIWLGNKALDMQFNAGVKAGYETYKSNYGHADLQVMMDIWWIQNGKGKITKINDTEITEEMWITKFAQAYAVEKQATEAPEKAKEIAVAAKVLKKAAVIHLLSLKYPGMGTNVSEELADAIVNKAGSAAIKKIAEKYKNHLEALTSARASSGSASTSGICQGTKEEQQECLAALQGLIAKRYDLLSNRIDYSDYQKTAAGLHPGGPGVPATIGMPKEGSTGAANLAKFKEAQRLVIATAYSFQYGQEILGINSSVSAIKSYFQYLKSNYGNLPKQGDHGNVPSYKVAESKVVVRVFNSIKHPVIYYGSFEYEDFVSGVAQGVYEKYLASEVKANAADDARAAFLKAHQLKIGGLIKDLTSLESRTNSLIKLAKSASGVFSYGQTSIDDLQKIVSDLGELKKDAQFGQEGWSALSVAADMKEMDSVRKARNSALAQLKAEYAEALKTYAKEVTERKLEKLEAEKKTTSPTPTPTVTKKSLSPTPVTSATKKTVAPIPVPSATKKAAAPSPLPSVTKKTVAPTPKPTATKKTVTSTPKPTATKKTTAPSGKTSSLPSGYSNIPNENVELVGFAFTSKGRAEMMIQDFFWSDVMYTINGALDLGVKTLNDVTSVPATGYRAEPYELKVGHVYAIKTRAGKYGIIQIALIEPGKRLYFFWRYQPDGSTSFKS